MGFNSAFKGLNQASGIKDKDSDYVTLIVLRLFYSFRLQTFFFFTYSQFVLFSRT